MLSAGQIALSYVVVGALWATYSLSTSHDEDAWSKIKTSIQEAKIDRAHQQLAYLLIFVLAAVFFAGFVVAWPLFIMFRVASWRLHSKTPEGVRSRRKPEAICEAGARPEE